MRFWQTQLNFALWVATVGCGVSPKQMTDYKHWTVRMVYRFHVYYTIRRILKRLQMILPDEDGWNSQNNPYNKEEFIAICREFAIPAQGNLWTPPGAQFRAGIHLQLRYTHGLSTDIMDI